MTASLSSTPGKAEDTTGRESEELKKFRQEWLDELQKRKKVLQGTSNASVEDALASARTSIISSRDTELESIIQRSVEVLKDQLDTLPIPTNHNAKHNSTLEAFAPPSLRKALGIYDLAVEREQTGNLDDALVLYRQAFKLHDKVDRAYQRELKLISIAKGQNAVIAADVSSILQSPKPKSLIKPTIISGSLLKIVQDFPADVRFEPENENNPVLLNRVPEEVLVLILSKLDHTSIERFAMLSRKARLITLDSGLWRVLVLATYKPPQIPKQDTLLDILEHYKFDYRRIYLEQPRLRLDGVYIAICHYVRPGLSDNLWANVSHLITYHRYFRFFPNGQVLSLLINEEKSPQDVIQILKLTLRMKGLLVGNWRLNDSTVHLNNLINASGRVTSPFSHGEVSIRHSNDGSRIGHSHQLDARYAFNMKLTLHSKPFGRWNKMVIQSYDSVNLETGDVSPVVLKHERPFWFSKVRSYG